MIDGISRRQFLKLTGSCSLAIVIGVSGGCGRKSAPSRTIEFSPNRYIEILPSDQVVVTITESEMGQGISTGLSMLVAEELGADWSKVQSVPATANRVYGDLSTGSSSSMREDWLPYRRAAAAAREMLVTAASNRWRVPAKSCLARDGRVTHVSSGRQFTFGELCQEAAQLAVPDTPVLKEARYFRIIGTRVPQLSTPSKVDGSLRYCMDLRLPGMKFATVVHCPWFGGRLKNFKVPDDPNDGVHEIFAVSGGVAVVATSSWIALSTAKDLRIEWDTTNLKRAGDETLGKSFERSASSTPLTVLQRGKVDLDTASVSASYHVPFEAHLTMEPQCCTIDPTGERYRLWVPTQVPTAVKELVVDRVLSAPERIGYKLRQKLTGRSPDDIEVNITPLGGGFGRRLKTDIVEEAIQIAERVKCPVNLLWSREEDLQHDFYRPASYHELHGSFGAGGTIDMWQHTVVGPSIKAADQEDFPHDEVDWSMMDGIAPPLYPTSSIRVGWIPHPTSVPIGPWRSVAASVNGFVVESFVDEMAHHLGADPLEFRLHLLREDSRATRVLDEVADLSDWREPTTGWRGLAIFASYQSYVAEVVHLERRGDRLAVSCVDCAIDCGRPVNPASIEAQLQGSVMFALTAATCSKAVIKDGRAAQHNFNDYKVIRLADAPMVRTRIVDSTAPPTGVGEPGVPPLAPALANAVFCAIGRRVRTLPIDLGLIQSGTA